MFDRYVNFIKTGRLGSEENIFLEMLQYYPCDTKFVILPMQMDHMGCGKTKRSYKDQIDELYKLYQKYPDNILPFIALDPRDEDMDKIFFNAIQNMNFKGVKIYPPLGYFPYDERFDNVFKYCEDNGVPIIAHGTGGNPVHFKGSNRELAELLKISKDPLPKTNNKKILCAEFTKPSNYKYVFQKFPKLKLDIAHLGGANMVESYINNPNDDTNWFKQIINMCKIYENLYTDISYTLYDSNLIPTLSIEMTDPIIKNKILFGSDWYMNEVEKVEGWFPINVRYGVGEEDWNKIAIENPKRFLNI